MDPDRKNNGVIVGGMTRFSLLSQGLVRIEYSPAGIFEERRSLRAIARPAPIAFADLAEKGGLLTLSGERMQIKYRVDGRPLHAGNLQAADKATGAVFWHPARIDRENLGGVHVSMDYINAGLIPAGVHPASVEHYDIFGPGMHGWNLWEFGPLLQTGELDAATRERYKHMTLDEILADADFAKLPLGVRELIEERRKFPPRLLSRAGYFLYNDTPTPRLNAETGWIEPPKDEAGYEDLYLFYYQRDFKQALKDYRFLCGAAPLIPRYALGVWYSRFPAHREAEWREIVGDFERHELPLDILVLDIQWHKRGWNGYDWNTDLFDDPDGFLQFLRGKGIHTTASTWPNRLPVEDSRFQRFIAEAGIEVAEKDIMPPDEVDGERKFEKYDLAIPSHAKALMDVLHKPVQDRGIDFWWVDNVSPIHAIEHPDHQLWTNHVFYTHQTRNYPERRAMIFGRASGLGAHRYPFHFTGDTWSQWPVLENQVEHTLRAGHLGQSFMTHDIGGYISPFAFIEPALYVRWVQFGVLSPIFRLHSAGSERRPWLYGEKVLAAFKTALRLRMELLPYLYTLAWQSAQEGLPMCRSNCLQYPNWEKGYGIWDSYCLGDRIYAAPVVRPGTVRRVCLPPGEWYSALSGERLSGDGYQYINQIVPYQGQPLHYYRAGSVMIKQPYCRKASASPGTLKIEVFPLGEDCDDEFVLYMDDGYSRRFEEGEFSLIRFNMREREKEIQLTIGSAQGRFPGLGGTLDYEIRVIGKRYTLHLSGQGRGIPIMAGDLFKLNGLALDEQHTINLLEN